MRKRIEKQSQPTSVKTLVDRLDAKTNEAAGLKNTTFSEVIEAYLEVASRSWSEATQRSEAARTRSLLPLLQVVGFNANAIYGELSAKVGAYSLKTTFIRLSKLYDFCIEVGVVSSAVNPFKVYMTKTAPNKFKTANVYKTKTVGITFEQAKLFTEQLQGSVKDTVEFILRSGLRISEVYSVQKDADGNYFVKGKGGKLRPVLVTPPAVLATVQEVREALKQCDITPHSLRKLAATELASAGVTGSNLQQIFGWSSLNTAQRYIQATETDRLKQIIKEVL